MKKQDWQELTKLSQGKQLTVEKVRVDDLDISIGGRFELPKLAQLNGEDQIFIMGFLRCEGSIKDMERLFGVSYPTIKGRLAKINEALGFVEKNPPQSRSEILELLEQGKITANEAVEMLKK
jgi:hypothetical protein